MSWFFNPERCLEKASQDSGLRNIAFICRLAPFSSLLKELRGYQCDPHSLRLHPADNAHPQVQGSLKTWSTAVERTNSGTWTQAKKSVSLLSTFVHHGITTNILSPPKRDLFLHRLTTYGRGHTISPKELYESPNVTYYVHVCVLCHKVVSDSLRPRGL